jgi:hypothetical protein
MQTIRGRMPVRQWMTASTGHAFAPRSIAAAGAPAMTSAFRVSEFILNASGATFTQRTHPTQRSASTLGAVEACSLAAAAGQFALFAAGQFAQSPLHGGCSASATTAAAPIRWLPCVATTAAEISARPANTATIMRNLPLSFIGSFLLYATAPCGLIDSSSWSCVY